MPPQNCTYTLFNIAEILGCAPSTPYKYLKRYAGYFEPYKINGRAMRFSVQGLMLFRRIYRWSTRDKLTILQIHERLARMYPGIKNTSDYKELKHRQKHKGWPFFMAIADVSLCLVTLILVIILIFS